MWINTVLDEVATGRPAKLSPTTTHVAVATGRRIAFLAAQFTAAAVNRSVDAFEQVQQRATRKAGQMQQRTRWSYRHLGPADDRHAQS